MVLKYFILGILFTLIVLAGGYGVYTLGKSRAGVQNPSSVLEPTLSVQKNFQQPFNGVTSEKAVDTPKIILNDAGGAVSESDKNQLIQKVVNPLIDYYREAGQGKLVLVNISLNTKPNNVDYPFVTEAEFDNGVKNSFVVERKSGDLSWWIPQCMGPCLLTDDFRAKYPEIIKILE